MRLRESRISKFPGGACPQTPLGSMALRALQLLLHSTKLLLSKVVKTPRQHMMVQLSSFPCLNIHAYQEYSGDKHLSKTSSAVVFPVIPDISTAFYWQLKIIRVQTQLFESRFFGITVFFPTAHLLHLQGHVAAIPTYTPLRTWSLPLQRDGLGWWCYCDTSFSCRTMRLSNVIFIITIIQIIFHNEQGVYIIQTSDSPSQASNTQFLYGL